MTLIQDDCYGLFHWFASKPDARKLQREFLRERNQMVITRVSGFTGRQHTRVIRMTPEQEANYVRCMNGEGLIQNLLPGLSADDREFLMTGVTPEEWKNAFGGSDE